MNRLGNLLSFWQFRGTGFDVRRANRFPSFLKLVDQTQAVRFRSSGNPQSRQIRGYRDEDSGVSKTGNPAVIRQLCLLLTIVKVL